MRINNKKMFSFLTIGTIFLAPLVTVISCGKNNNKNVEKDDEDNKDVEKVDYSTSWINESRRDVRVARISEDGLQPYIGKDYMFSPTLIAGTSQIFSEANNSYSTLPFRPTLIGKPTYDSAGEIISGQNTKLILKFEFFNSISIINKDGDTFLFDSDAETGDNSINSENFNSKLSSENISEIKFGISNGKWIRNRTGEETNYDFQSGDVLAGINYSRYGTSASRHGGNTEDLLIKSIDTYSNNKYKTSFNSPSSTSNMSGWDGEFGLTYGIDTSKTLSQPVENSNFSIFFNNNFSNRKIKLLWNVFFSKKGGFNIVPSNQMISDEPSDELVNHVKDVLSVSLNDARNSIKSSMAWKSGIYKYYWNKWEDYLTGGQYYIEIVNADTIQWRKNGNYVNSDFKERTDTVNSYTYTFIDQSENDPSTIYEGYKAGRYINSPLSYIPQSDYSKISDNPDGYGRVFIKGRTASNQVQGNYTKFNFIPDFQNANDIKQVFFNDGFAKIMYGKDLRSLKNDLNNDWISHMVSGSGLQFRTSIYSAINWYNAALLDRNGQNWTSNLAPEQKLGTTTPIKSQAIYSNYAVNSIGSKQELTQITQEERKNPIEQGETIVAGSTKDIEEIKSNIKEALDRAGISEDEKVVFELPIDYMNWTRDIRRVLEKIRLSINSLDTRLNVVAAMVPIDLTSGESDTSGKDATNGEVWRESYMPLIDGWSFAGINSPEATQEDYVKKYVVPRRAVNGGGMSAFPVTSYITNFETDSPTVPLLLSAQTLQQGSLLSLAYYSKNKSSIPTSFAKFGDFSEEFFKSMKESFPKMSELENLIQSTGYTQVPQNIKNLMISYFENFDESIIFNSTMNSINSHKYLGLGDISSNTPDNTSLLNEIKLLQGNQFNHSKSLFNDVFVEAIKNAEFSMRSKTSDYTNDEWEQVVTAYDTYIGNSWFYIKNRIGNREQLSYSLTKNWYLNPSFDQVQYIGSVVIKN